ncbi:MAG: CRISPR-associated endonuclease Cas2 [Desulfobacteraceae bacterium]|nr:CRISPR-associated endonuclease Cas2 [Desulfobacteraceae bacterium]
MFYLVCFDIVDDRKRYRVVKALKGFGVRVQKSVFECPGLTDEKLVKLRHRIDDIIDHSEDSVRFYPACRKCVAGVEYSGIGDPPVKQNFSVVI